MTEVWLRIGDEGVDIHEPFRMDAEQRRVGAKALGETWEERTICNIIRKIHETAHNTAVTALCIEAIYMAKSMNKRLRHYKVDWDKGLWMPDAPGGS